MKELEGLNKAASGINKANAEKGFYDEKREIGTLLMLCVSELAEALEADRKDEYAELENFHVNVKSFGFKNSFESCIKDTFEDEIADTVIRLLDLCGHLKVDIEQHVKLKLEYNAKRPNKHGKKY